LIHIGSIYTASIYTASMRGLDPQPRSVRPPSGWSPRCDCQENHPRAWPATAVRV